MDGFNRPVTAIRWGKGRVQYERFKGNHLTHKTLASETCAGDYHGRMSDLAAGSMEFVIGFFAGESGEIEVIASKVGINRRWLGVIPRFQVW
ncbi:hypothetical protein PAXRUDRAFT_479901 [Paxillus rubicundulus Ve08.2h10]|uniref:Uncharacterized protein n=1 Tax=Paxillus rubicundulus Ve08.2h10 TaxID=930991 RepID=A0A0D0DPR7_9AGAM|nr:hypothetical protein PAXRUDRAFT_479901 [Paxillus rubicundulus Ve08.2h10]